jgi:hypothetical protein
MADLHFFSHYTPLSLFYYGPPLYLPLASFLTYRQRIGQGSTLGLLYTLLAFRALLIHRPDDEGSTLL